MVVEHSFFVSASRGEGRGGGPSERVKCLVTPCELKGPIRRENINIW